MLRLRVNPRHRIVASMARLGGTTSALSTRNRCSSAPRHRCDACEAAPVGSGRRRRDARQQRNNVLRGSDRFCRQAWIRFFSMNRHQRTVSRAGVGRGGARLLRRLLHEDWAGLVMDHVPVCADVASRAWRSFRRRNAPPPVASGSAAGPSRRAATAWRHGSREAGRRDGHAGRRDATRT